MLPLVEESRNTAVPPLFSLSPSPHRPSPRFLSFLFPRAPRLHSLAQEASLEEMVRLLVDPPPEGADEKRVHKFPYMACEAICCENDHVLDALVSTRDGEMLRRIFSLLDKEGDLDDRLTGYFEKVVFVLLRLRCVQLMAFLNAGGLPLFRKFVRHLDNYSIMQVVEKLFLFQPVSDGQCQPVGLDLGEGGGEDVSGSGSGPDLSLLECQWSSMPEVVDILVEQLVEGGDMQAAGSRDGEAGAEEDKECSLAAATHTHVGSLLLEVIGNAHPDSVFIRHLTDKIARLADVAIPALDLSQPPPLIAAEALRVVREERSSMLSALNIVEALLSRPQAIKLHWDMGQQQAALSPLLPPPAPMDTSSPPEPPSQEDLNGASLPAEETQEPMASPAAGADGRGEQGVDGEGVGGEGAEIEGLEGESGVATLSEEVVGKLLSSLPLVRVYLLSHAMDDRTVTTQSREAVPKLGLTRLRLVRHVEALVKLCSPRVDRALEKEGVLTVCLDMLFKYEWTSVLHQSVTRIVTWIMDAGPSRVGLQAYLVTEGAILQRILEADAHNESEERPESQAEASQGEPGRGVFEGRGRDAKGLEGEGNEGGAGGLAGEAVNAMEEDREPTAEGPAALDVQAAAGVSAEEMGREEGRQGEDGAMAVSASHTSVGSGRGVGGLAAAQDMETSSCPSIAHSESSDRSRGEHRAVPRCRRGYMGHLFIMAQAIMEAARLPLVEMAEGEGLLEVPFVAGGLQSATEGHEPQPSSPSDPTLGPLPSSLGPQSRRAQASGGLEPGASLSSFAQFMGREVDAALRQRWTEFSEGRLTEVTARQGHPLGGFPIPSRADENTLSTKFDDGPGPDFDSESEHLAQRLSGVDVGEGGDVGEELSGGQGDGSGMGWSGSVLPPVEGGPDEDARLLMQQLQRQQEEQDEELHASHGLALGSGSGLGDGAFETKDGSSAQGPDGFGGGSGGSKIEGNGQGSGGVFGQDSIPGLVAGGWAAKAFAEGVPSGGTFGEGWADFSNVSFPPLDSLHRPVGTGHALASSGGGTTGTSSFASVLDGRGFGSMLGAGGGGEGEGATGWGPDKEEGVRGSEEEEEDFFSSSTTVHLTRSMGGEVGSVTTAGSIGGAEEEISADRDGGGSEESVEVATSDARSKVALPLGGIVQQEEDEKE